MWGMWKGCARSVPYYYFSFASEKIKFNWSSNRCFDNFEEMVKSFAMPVERFICFVISVAVAVAGDDIITISKPWACRKKLYFWQPFLAKWDCFELTWFSRNRALCFFSYHFVASDASEMHCCHISVQIVKYSLIYKAGGAILVKSVYICNVRICIFLEFRFLS